jgi:RimJ/RimL family protein N-acetyltransferase
MPARCPTPAAPLVGLSVRLRPWAVEEAAWYVAARDADVFRWTTEARTVSVAAVAEAIRRNTAQPAWVGLAITDVGSGELLGNIALVPTAARPHVGEVSYRLAPQSRGRGAPTEAVRLLVAWACAKCAAYDRRRLTSVVLRSDPACPRCDAEDAGGRDRRAQHQWRSLGMTRRPRRPRCPQCGVNIGDTLRPAARRALALYMLVFVLGVGVGVWLAV